MELTIPILLNCILVVIVYLVGKYTAFSKLPYFVRQIIIGVLFGAVSSFASSYGVEWLGAVVNVRDAAPLSAGLIFGAPAGIIAGFIGGLYRWFSVFWGAGTYTQLACSIATILAGFMAAGLRKLMFDNKKPTWGYGVCIAVVCEVVHMVIIYLTNMDDSSYAFEFVRGASLPMILGNAIAVGVSIIIISLLSHEKLTHIRGHERIAQTFQRWLLVCIVSAYLVTSAFTFLLQSGIVRVETEKVFTSAITDVVNDVREKSDDYLLSLAKKVSKSYRSDPTTPLSELAFENNLIEINIVDKTGLIINSTEQDLIGNFNMSSTEQSKEFMVLLEGAQSYVQEYCPVGSDGVTMRKFAGLPLPEGGFIQVGYSAYQFRGMIDGFVIDVTKNRHVGKEGFVAVCDENLNLVTDTSRNGRHISTIGIEPTEDMLARRSSTKLETAVVFNNVTNYREEYMYAFTFVEGYCIIAAMPRYEATFMRDSSIYNSVFMQVIIFATLFVFIYILIKKVIINNLNKINNDLAQITNGNLNVTVNVRSNQEFASLSDDINSTVTTLKKYIAEAAARIDKELEYAKQIQLSALPTNFPTTTDFDVYAQMIAAKEVGGDFYDFYQLDDDTLAFLVADVSGKGIPAAMFMMTAKTIIKDLAESGMAVNEIFTKANEKLCENNESGMFVTAWMGILKLSTGKLQFANAGHNPPLIRRGNGKFEYLRTRAGFVLAGMDGVVYKANELSLEAGDRIFLYTDGVTEATDSATELYGEKRLSDFLSLESSLPAKELLPALKADIDRFVGEAPQFDDITMLVFDYLRNKGGKKKMEKVFPAKTEALTDVLGFVEGSLEEYEASIKSTMAICVAIEEVFVNVANYAYKDGEGDVSLTVEFDSESRDVRFTMADSGVPFDPLKKPDPDVTLSAEERSIGGLGIFITKKTMDSLEYRYENGKNVLVMTKKI